MVNLESRCYGQGTSCWAANRNSLVHSYATYTSRIPLHVQSTNTGCLAWLQTAQGDRLSAPALTLWNSLALNFHSAPSLHTLGRLFTDPSWAISSRNSSFPIPLVLKPPLLCSLMFSWMLKSGLQAIYLSIFLACGIHGGRTWLLSAAVFPETQKSLSAFDNYLINCAGLNWIESGDVLNWSMAWVSFLPTIKTPMIWLWDCLLVSLGMNWPLGTLYKTQIIRNPMCIYYLMKARC